MEIKTVTSGVTKSGRVWRKVLKSEALSVRCLRKGSKQKTGACFNEERKTHLAKWSVNFFFPSILQKHRIVQPRASYDPDLSR